MKHSDVNRLFTAAQRLNSATNWLNGIKSEDGDERRRLNKACEWLEENLLNYWSQINANNTDDFIENFKKAMEE